MTLDIDGFGELGDARLRALLELGPVGIRFLQLSGQTLVIVLQSLQLLAPFGFFHYDGRGLR
jgi:hypothetical protein